MQVSEHFSKVMERVTLAFGLILLGLVVGDLFSPHTPVGAQNSGNVGIQAESITVFSSQTTSAASGGYWNCGITSGACPVLQDIGQGSNLLFYCNTSFQGTIDLEWTPPPITPSSVYNVIAQATWNGDSACHSLPFGSYFPNLRSRATISSGSISAWYTAISGPVPFAAPAFGTAGPTAPINCDLNYSFAVPNTNIVLVANPVATGDTVVICGMSVSFNGATSAGTIALEWGNSSSSGCGSLSSPPSWDAFTTSSTPQYLNVNYQQRSPTVGHNFGCIVNNSGASAEVAISYASVHLP